MIAFTLLILLKVSLFVWGMRLAYPFFYVAIDWQNLDWKFFAQTYFGGALVLSSFMVGGK